MLQQIQQHTHRHLTSAHLAQTMSLLHLSADELRETLQGELANNPALELADYPTCPGCGRKLAQSGPCPVCTAKTQDVVVFSSPVEMFESGNRLSRRDPYEQPEEVEAAESPSLPAYLLSQIGPDLAAEERPIAAHLLTALDDDGLLASDPAEVAAYFHTSRLRVEKVRGLIQRAEPTGCASISPQETLSIQIESLKETQNVPALAEACLAHFDLLARQDFVGLAQLLQAETNEVERAAHFIRANLNPYPARTHWGGRAAPLPVYRTPDVVISLGMGNALMVEIAQPTGGLLRLNPLFKQALREESGEKSQQWQDDFVRANLLIKCMQQRAGAMELMLARLAHIQREFILHGEAHLRPLTRAALAKELGLHESTISRAVAGKSVQLPNRRIVPLGIFFEKHLSVRHALKELVRGEREPLRDDDLTRRLRQMGFKVARRTVAKYRAMEGILPSHLRK